MANITSTDGTEKRISLSYDSKTDTYRPLDINVLDKGGSWISNDIVGLGNETVMWANSDREELFIQNLGTYPLFVKYGQSASLSNFNFILTSGSAVSVGDGGTLSDLNYAGEVSVYSNSPNYIAWERGTSSPTGFWKDCRDTEYETNFNNLNPYLNSGSIDGIAYGQYDGSNTFYIEAPASPDAQSIEFKADYKNTQGYRVFPYINWDTQPNYSISEGQENDCYARMFWNDALIFEMVNNQVTVAVGGNIYAQNYYHGVLLNGQYGEFRFKFETKNAYLETYFYIHNND
jgi:hypothetical protein